MNTVILTFKEITENLYKPYELVKNNLKYRVIKYESYLQNDL